MPNMVTCTKNLHSSSSFFRLAADSANNPGNSSTSGSGLSKSIFLCLFVEFAGGVYLSVSIDFRQYYVENRRKTQNTQNNRTIWNCPTIFYNEKIKSELINTIQNVMIGFQLEKKTFHLLFN